MVKLCTEENASLSCFRRFRDSKFTPTITLRMCGCLLDLSTRLLPSWLTFFSSSRILRSLCWDKATHRQRDTLQILRQLKHKARQDNKITGKSQSYWHDFGTIHDLITRNDPMPWWSIKQRYYIRRQTHKKLEIETRNKTRLLLQDE
jgi:hypothetical protein